MTDLSVKDPVDGSVPLVAITGAAGRVGELTIEALAAVREAIEDVAMPTANLVQRRGGQT